MIATDAPRALIAWKGRFAGNEGTTRGNGFGPGPFHTAFSIASFIASALVMVYATMLDHGFAGTSARSQTSLCAVPLGGIASEWSLLH